MPNVSNRTEPILVVSNRLPYDRPRGAGHRVMRNIGGLVSAVEPVLVSRGGTWIGWDGALLASTAQVEARLREPLGYSGESGVELRGIPLSDRDFSQYYHGFSNRALWPLFHDFPGKAVFRAEDWAAYVRVNRRFADVVAGLATRDSRIWVHDYHLMLVPRLLRERGFRGRIDFFTHIPFPAPEIFRVLPWREEVLRGILAADAAGFHVGLYRDNFVAAARSLVGAKSEPGPQIDTAIRHDSGSTLALAAPIGIDVDEFDRIARLPEVAAHARRLRASYGGRSVLLGADRLDYTKGITERLHAVERLLNLRPDLAGRISLVQFVVPSRHQVAEYRHERREIEGEVGRINGQYARDGWIPIHYRFAGLRREELVAHYLSADVALVTPLRDGMNLVASEFAASRYDEDGVLVASEFAGVAEQALGAILVNPYDSEGTARAIARALDLDREERRRRMATLRERVAANPVSRWAARCLGVELPAADTASVRTPKTTGRSKPPHSSLTTGN